MMKSAFVLLAIMAHVQAYVQVIPYQALLLRNNVTICGGTLISENHVLTTGHCANFPKNETLSIVTGVHEGGPNERHNARKITIHPIFIKAYPYVRPHYDIAVITLDTPAKESPEQNAVSLPTSNIMKKVFGIVASWKGMIIGEDLESPIRRYLEVTPSYTCEGGPRYFETRLCTKSTGTCIGDLGSPLVYNDTVIGILSTRECENGKAQWYTNPFRYKEFIEKAMKD